MNHDIVKTIPLFASVPKRRHAQIASWADDVDTAAGTTLTRQDGYAREFFEVVSGTADVMQDGERIGTVGPGDFFGEVGLLRANWQQTATVVATSPMRLLVMGRREFQAMMSELPSVSDQVLRAAVSRAHTRPPATSAGRTLRPVAGWA
jgi:CRP-like cAMP-binding protein